MPKFTDATGAVWLVEINVNTLKRVRSLLDIDLANLTAGQPPLLTRLALDVVLLCDVLYVVCKPQADALSISDEVFGQSLGGEALAGGYRALMGALTDFFHHLGRTEIVRAIETQAQLLTTAIAAAEERIKAIDLDAIAKTSGNSFTDTLESSALTPDHSLSGS